MGEEGEEVARKQQYHGCVDGDKWYLHNLFEYCKIWCCNNKIQTWNKKEKKDPIFSLWRDLTTCILYAVAPEVGQGQIVAGVAPRDGK